MVIGFTLGIQAIRDVVPNVFQSCVTLEPGTGLFKEGLLLAMLLTVNSRWFSSL